jgi:hypothetical protein
MDPVNLRSWPGPGTAAVTDIVNGSNGTLEADTSGSYGVNSSFVFDGTDDNLVIGSPDSSLGFGSGGFTIALWCRSINYDNAYPYLIDFRTGGDTSNIVFYIQRKDGSNGGLEVYIGSTILSGASGTSIAEGDWKYVAVTRSGTTHTTYINGVQDQTATSGATTLSTPGSISIAQRYTDAYHWNGNIGPIHMYNRALTATELIKNYDTLKGRVE